ncbi:3-oxoadipate enol-lactonase [Roseovarius aestuariivivens]|uniref:3-oxoadipate enol-lactonase n=1 Tax=Roseovarius aestuariivivens TaxID=1888910 RepID=UPI001080EA08|nr:3-oxoadipate enol-lactonase [Roseovarius aestuariivivens]
MSFADLDGIRLHYRDEGPRDGPVVVFSNSLGTNLTMWDSTLPHLPEGLRIIRYDKRGHGQSEVPPPPYSMGTLIHDAEMLLDHLGVQECCFVGLSIGGMTGQGLAVKRLDLIRCMVLSNTATKIATPDMWDERIKAVEEGGVAALADSILERWFSKRFLASPELARWRDLLVSTPDAGYAGCSAAISGTDLYTPTSGLRLPVLGIAGTEDGSTPPDLMRETVGLIPGSRLEIMRGVGHIPPAEDPKGYAKLLTGFLRETGHIPG